jgi:hypothetical protein
MVSWVFGANLRIVMSSIMRRRDGACSGPEGWNEAARFHPDSCGHGSRMAIRSSCTTAGKMAHRLPSSGGIHNHLTGLLRPATSFISSKTMTQWVGFKFD